MSMITTGNVTLPDGRVVHAVQRWKQEWVDGHSFALNQISIEIKWLDGTPLKTDEYNEKVAPGYYLHEWVGERLILTGNTETEDYSDYDYF